MLIWLGMDSDMKAIYFMTVIRHLLKNQREKYGMLSRVIMVVSMMSGRINDHMSPQK